MNLTKNKCSGMQVEKRHYKEGTFLLQAGLSFLFFAVTNTILCRADFALKTKLLVKYSKCTHYIALQNFQSG